MEPLGFTNLIIDDRKTGEVSSASSLAEKAYSLSGWEKREGC